MTRPVIVTRTLPDANETAESLKTLGFAPVLSSMLEIVPKLFDPWVLDQATQIIFTSANGARMLTGSFQPTHLTAWCVGPTTSAAARSYGYASIVEGPGNAAQLAGTIIAARPGADELFVHVANENAAGEVVARLRAAGIKAAFLAAYRTVSHSSLTPDALMALAGPVSPILLIHSARAASAVAVSGADLSGAPIVAISEAALAPLKGRSGRGKWVAAAPREADLLEAVKAAALALDR